MTDALHGWLILDKPYGLGSTQAVSAVKRLLRQAGYPKTKIGHGGTLDPLATGVLPIALGEATKLAGRMLDSDKIYDFTIQFGKQTDTLDTEGQVIATSDSRPLQSDIEAVLPRFTGLIDQVPPIYSALKIDGQRAYDLARAGETPQMKTRAVHIYSLALVSADAHSATVSACVSKGTYIRSLARDIALALGTVGHVSMLRRIKAGPFALSEAIFLDKLQASANAPDIAQYMLPLTRGLDDIPALPVTTDQALALKQGKVLPVDPLIKGIRIAMSGDTSVALVDCSGSEIRVVRGFNL